MTIVNKVDTTFIEVDRVIRVLLADGWHHASWDGNQTGFSVGRYEYGVVVTAGSKFSLGNRDEVAKVSEIGFCFDTDSGTRIAGPLSTVLAVEFRPSPARLETKP